MKQYNVIYFDNSCETVEAYQYTFQNGRAVFDKGHGQMLHLFGVKYVEPLGEAVV